MKKKIWIPVLAVVLILILIFAGICFLSPFKISTGIYIAADSPVIVFDKGSGEPVILLAAQGKENRFAKLQTGDRILIVHDGTMMLSYPAQMNVFFCFRLEKGTYPMCRRRHWIHWKKWDGLREAALGRINKANLKKTVYYLKRNGFVNTWYAVRERLEERKQPPYAWVPPSEAELEAQRKGWEGRGFSVTFSILVPAYRTKPEYLKELMDSLRSQTYPKWELILADATEDDSVEQVVRSYAVREGVFREAVSGSSLVSGETFTDCDERIRYVHLERNAGIAENTNQALPYATGDYIGLLDHDDILTANALYEMAAAIEGAKRRGMKLQMLYSDEDKCNGDRTEYYEPNYKENFNLDLLLSNNYICHFLVMDRKLMQKLKFRQEFDGAQDYDLVLRAASEENEEQDAVGCLKREATIVHIPKVLYHWRCHTGSTAENPQSKLYAYEAGRRAIQDFADRAGWRTKVVDTAHVGFYRLEYEGDVFDSRADVGAVGGRVVGRGRVVGGRLTESGSILYENLPIHYSGYLHRAELSQDAYAVDLRNIRVRPECRALFRRITGVSYQTLPGTDVFDASVLPEDCDIQHVSLAFGRALRDAGYRVLYLPQTKR